MFIVSQDPAEGFILNYTLLIGDASFSNFQKVSFLGILSDYRSYEPHIQILDLKGTPKGEQNALLDSFLTITSTKSELATMSFLSSLDMDPSANAGGVVNTTPGGSRVSLPSLVAHVQASDGIFSTLGSPPLTPSVGTDGAAGKVEQGPDRKVFAGFGRFVNFVKREKGQGDLPS